MARWLRISYLDGRDAVEVRIGPKAEVAFERHFKISLTKAGQDISAEHLYYLAWTALHHSGKEPLDFDSFLDVLDDVDGVDTEAPVDPIEPVQPVDSSSS